MVDVAHFVKMIDQCGKGAFAKQKLPTVTRCSLVTEMKDGGQQRIAQQCAFPNRCRRGA
jgi:hypothetical protein